MAAVQLARSILLVTFLLDLVQVSDDIGSAILVDFYLTGCFHLLDPADCVLSVGDLLFPSAELLLKLLYLIVLLLDFGGQTLAVEPGGLH